MMIKKIKEFRKNIDLKRNEIKITKVNYKLYTVILWILILNIGVITYLKMPSNYSNLIRMLVLIILLIPISIELSILIELIRDSIHGNIIKFGNININTNELNYNIRLIELLNLSKYNMRLHKEEIEYLLANKYKYFSSVSFKNIIGAMTIPSIIVFFNNVVNFGGNMRKVLSGISQQAATVIFILIIISIFTLYMIVWKFNSQIEIKNRINRALVKIRDDLNYYINSKVDKQENCEYFL